MQAIVKCIYVYTYRFMCVNILGIYVYIYTLYIYTCISLGSPAGALQAGARALQIDGHVVRHGIQETDV